MCSSRLGSFVVSSLISSAAFAAQSGVAPTIGPQPTEYVAPGPIHRVLVDDTAFDRLLGLDAVRAAEDYGSFRFVLADARRTGGVDGLRALGAAIADERTLVELNGYVVDGARGGRIVSGGSLGDLVQDVAPIADGESRLQLVQFAGPVREEWLAELAATGTHVVSYVASDAYVVKGGPEAVALVQGLLARPFVLAVGAYEPAFKLRPELRDIAATDAHEVIVQVVADAEGEEFARRIHARAIRSLAAPERVLAWWNVRVVLDGANVHELARDGRVFAIEPVLEMRLLDERQGQIVAGNIDATGTQAASPAYLAWLMNKGFPGPTNAFDFSVDVVDDGVDRGSTSDVNVEFRVGGVASGASRLVYNHNYSGDALADGRGGHGNINASIIGGHNTATGAAFEDAAGYQYGLGIAPWVKLGNTKVFSNAGEGVFGASTATRLAAAYAAGARISSNSWGATTGTSYSTDSQAHDRAVRDAQTGIAGNQELTIVFAAGNDGSGASTVRPPGTAKNIITVGAGESWRPTGTDGCGYENADANDLRDVATFSSRGPTRDGRRKPELLAPGTHVQGAASRAVGYDGSGVCDLYFPSGQTAYTWSSGTSHSTPAVAGACALVRQWSANHGFAEPSPAMQKAVLVASAAHMSGAGANDTLWSNGQGMGRVNLGRAFDPAARLRVDQSVLFAATGTTFTLSGSVAAPTTPFRVVLAWTDAPGATTGSAYVNDLDLEVTLNGTLHRGNVFDGANSTAGGTRDARNNLESVFLPAGTTGSFTVVVRARNIVGDGVPGNGDTTDQDFALLVYNGSTAAPAPEFSLTSSSNTGAVTPGKSISSTIAVTPFNGFTAPVTLFARPTIPGISYSFATNPIPGGSGTSKFKVTTTSALVPGTYVITVTGVAGGMTRTTLYTLTVEPGPVSPGVLRTFSVTPNLAVPDGNATGVTSTISVPDSFTVSSVAVSTVIDHTYEGDLVVTLIAPDDTAAILHNRTGGDADDVTSSFSIVTPAHEPLSVFNGRSARGAWKLRVQDLATGDTGRLYRWKITFNGETALSPNMSIPDNEMTGATSTIDVTKKGTVSSVQVRVRVIHPYSGDLEIALIAPDETTVLLHNRTGGGEDDVNTEYPDFTAPNESLAAFAGKPTLGPWRLRVRDLAAGDTGTLVSWTLSVHGQ